MRRFSGGLVGNRTRGAVAPGAGLVAAALLAVAAAPAGATITPIPSPHASAGAAAAVRAAVDPAKFPLGQIAPAFYTGASQILSVPPNGNPVGTGDAASALSPFPRDGAAFLVLSTGDATGRARPAGRRSQTPTTVAACNPERGSGAQDLTVLQIPFSSPSVPQALRFRPASRSTSASSRRSTRRG